MGELALTRSDEDRSRYDLDGYGSLATFTSSVAKVELTARDGTFLRTERQGTFRTTISARDQTDQVIGEYRTRQVLTSSGDVTWHGEQFSLRWAGLFKSGFDLEQDGRRLLRVRGKGRGTTPVSVTVDDESLEPGLVLFIVAVVRALVADTDTEGDAAAAII